MIIEALKTHPTPDARISQSCTERLLVFFADAKEGAGDEKSPPVHEYSKYNSLELQECPYDAGRSYRLFGERNTVTHVHFPCSRVASCFLSWVKKSCPLGIR